MEDRTRINFVVTGFENLEKQLAECMEFLPFIEENKKAISPKFVPIIMDSCSLIESILYEITSSSNKERFNLRKYCLLHESNLQLEENASLFLTLPVQILQPYKRWGQKSPVWWNAYNKLKHDRLNNFHYATYTNAVNALAGLHQLMSKQREFIGTFLKAGWVDTRDFEVTENLCSSVHEGTNINVVIESKLFASSTDENFVNPSNSDERYFDINYDAYGLSERIRNMLFAHEDW